MVLQGLSFHWEVSNRYYGFQGQYIIYLYNNTKAPERGLLRKTGGQVNYRRVLFFLQVLAPKPL